VGHLGSVTHLVVNGEFVGDEQPAALEQAWSAGIMVVDIKASKAC
jgi:hypothetical protein